MNLSAYIDFSVQFDLTGDKPVVVLTDTGNYPAGVSALVKGNFLITQPDMGTFGKMNFDDPDIGYSDGALMTYRYSSRGACDGPVQAGTWSITYTVKATGYDITTVKKTFYVAYTEPKMAIEADFDVFTPLLQYKDKTDYSLSGFTSSVTRTWNISADTAGITITGSSVNQSLQYSGNYYDSAYLATLSSIITWTSATYGWLTIKDKLSVNSTDYANTPPACGTLMDQLRNYSDGLDCGCSGPGQFGIASTLLNVINKAMADANYDGLYANIARYENIVLGSFSYVNTGAKMKPYVYDCGAITVVNTAANVVTGGEVISWTVGGADYAAYPQNGESSFTDARLFKKTVMFMNKGNIPLTPGVDYTYNPDVDGSRGRLSLVGQQFNTEETVVIGTVNVATGSGSDGDTSYVHIKYSNDNGTTFTNNDGEDPGDYIGTYTDFTEADSDDVSTYTWAKIQGPAGTVGPEGPEGPAGPTGDPGPASAYEGSLNDF